MVKNCFAQVGTNRPIGIQWPFWDIIAQKGHKFKVQKYENKTELLNFLYKSASMCIKSNNIWLRSFIYWYVYICKIDPRKVLDILRDQSP